MRRLRHVFLGLDPVDSSDDEESDEEDQDGDQTITALPGWVDLQGDSSGSEDDSASGTAQVYSRGGRLIKRPGYLKDYTT